MAEPEKHARTEYRTCGDDSRRGSWQGSWKPSKPSASEVAQLARNNDEVWVERREVWETKPERVDV